MPGISKRQRERVRHMDRAINRIADLFPYGALQASTSPADLILRAADEIETLRTAARCAHCQKPATCVGVYEDSRRPPEFACDDCCGHGNEDGWCHRIVDDADASPTPPETPDQGEEG